MRLIRAVMYAVCAVLILAAVMCVVADMGGSVPSVVYADDTEEVLPQQTQPGLMGIMSGISTMRSYYHEVQTKKISSPGAEILVGTRAVKRALIDRNAFFQGAAMASAFGYTALEQVADHQMSYDDYYTLLRIVEAEATGGDELSKLAIANVVLNRTKDSHFPDTVSEVVYQRLDGAAQFSPVSDGRIYSVTITKSTISAVERALAGEDNSQGALFFVARASAAKENLKWFDAALVKLFEYGGHEFCTFREYVG